MQINVNYKTGKRISIPQTRCYPMNQIDFERQVSELAKDIKTNPFFSKVYGLKFDLIRSVTITN